MEVIQVSLVFNDIDEIGFVTWNLFSLEVDLSKELTAPSRPGLEEKVEATAQVW